jgi:hypothetical protein
MSRPKGSPRTPGSGRKAGTPNKATVQRRLLLGERRRADGVPLAKEVLEESMLHYVRLASECLPPDRGKWKREKDFHRYREAADLRARWLAPYQSPQYRSITVQPSHDGVRAKGTPAVDMLEDFIVRLARSRRVINPPEPKTIDAVPVPDETPAEAVKVVDGKNGNGG